MVDNTHQAKRRCFSVTYADSVKPRLRTGKKDYEISDISEMGVRFYHNRKIKAGQLAFGNVSLLCGESIDVEGMIVGEDGVFSYMIIHDPIDKALLQREQQYISRDM